MSFKRYETYKDSGVAWLGEVPGHWETNNLKRTTYLKARVGWKGLTSDEFREDSFAYLVTGSDFRGRYVKWGECYQVDKERYEDDKFIQLRNGDLLITKDGTIGKLAIVSGLDKPACLNSGIFLIRTGGDYVMEFMYWILSSRSFSLFCDLRSYGSTINHLYQNVFEEFIFPLPPLPEQQAIATFLDRETARIDALVAEQQRLIALLQEKRQAVISHAVTKGLDLTVPMKDSGVEWLGEVPGHWEVGPVKRFLSSLNGRRVPLSGEERAIRQGEFPYYGASGVIDQVDDYLFEDELVLVSEDGANLLNRATPIAFTAKGRYWVNNHAHILRPSTGSPTYWASRIESIDVAPFVTGAAQPKLTAEALGALLVSAPPTEKEQDAIATFLDRETARIDALITDANQAITLLQERRTALISAAVTGQIDVRAHAEALPA